jgi:hypothetical protein
MGSQPLFGKIFFFDIFCCQNAGMVWKTFFVIKLDSPSSEKIRLLEPFLGTCHFVVKSCRNMCSTCQQPHEYCFSCNITSSQINWALWDASLNRKITFLAENRVFRVCARLNEYKWPREGFWVSISIRSFHFNVIWTKANLDRGHSSCFLVTYPPFGGTLDPLQRVQEYGFDSRLARTWLWRYI